MKVFEDVLICGTQGLFQNERDLHGSPFFESPGQKTRPCAFTKTFCKTLLQRMRLESSDARKGEFGEDLGSIQWNLKSKNELGQGLFPFLSFENKIDVFRSRNSRTGRNGSPIDRPNHHRELLGRLITTRMDRTTQKRRRPSSREKVTFQSMVENDIFCILDYPVRKDATI